MPSFKAKGKLKPAIYCQNGLEDLTAEEEPINLGSDYLSDQSTVISIKDLKAEKEPINSNSLSDWSSVVKIIDTVTLGDYNNLKFSGSINVFLDELSEKLVAIFAWTSLVYLDSHELVEVIPEPEKKFGPVEAIFNYYSTLVPIFSPLQYAE
ncbi:hypothetical protein BJX70DRAFT_403512 [Aspergillus crustosus]